MLTSSPGCGMMPVKEVVAMATKRKRGRPPKGGAVMTKVIRIRLDEETYERLKETGIPVADKIREIIREYFMKKETKHDENEVSDD